MHYEQEEESVHVSPQFLLKHLEHELLRLTYGKNYRENVTVVNKLRKKGINTRQYIIFLIISSFLKEKHETSQILADVVSQNEMHE